MSSGESIASLWERLESWAGTNAPDMLMDLNPGASDAAIDALEQGFGHTLPDAYRVSLKIHDGESDGWPNRVFADMGAYHSAESALNDRKMGLSVASHGNDFDESEIAEQIENDIITVDGPVRPLTFSPDWLPIMNCNGDVFWALDYAPADGGQPGQVIQVDLEGCYWGVVAPDFRGFFQQYVEALEAGEYEVQEGLATKEPVDPLELARDRLIDETFANSPSKDDLEKKEPGELVYVAGYRGAMIINGGEILLRGSLKGTTPNQLLRVTISIGKPRAFGVLAPIHDIVEWERVV